MADYKRDTEHSWDEIDDAIEDLLYVLYAGSNPKARDLIFKNLPEHLVLREIEFLTSRCEEMDRKSRTSFYAFLFDAMGESLRQHRISRTAHTLYLGSLLIPMLSKTDANYAGFIEYLIPRARRELDSCRPRFLSSDFITGRDLPWMRGELLELILESLLSPVYETRLRSGDNEYCAWLGSHVNEVIRVLPALKQRGSMDPVLVCDLVDSVNNPLTDGAL